MSVAAAYLSVIAIWATTPLAIQWSVIGDDALFGPTARMAIGTLVCVALTMLLRKALPLQRRALWSYFAGGMGIVLTMYCVYNAARYIPSGLLSVVFGATPLVTSVLAAVMLSERAFTLGKMLGIVVGIGGLGIVFHDQLRIDVRSAFGVFLVFLGTIAQGGSAVWIKRLDAGISALPQTTGSLLVALPLFCAIWFAMGATVPIDIPVKAAASILYLGVFGSVIGFMLYFYALRHSKPTSIALITLVTPVLALLLGHTLNDEAISPFVWLGATMVLGGMSLHQWGDRLFGRLPLAVGR